MGRCFFTLCFLCSALTALAQTNVKGRVRDAENGEAIFSANVVIKGTTTGVTTDFDGEFRIKIESFPAVLQISFIGYKAKEVTLTAPTDKLDIKLAASQIMLEEARFVCERV